MYKDQVFVQHFFWQRGTGLPGKPYKTLKGVELRKPGLSAGKARPILNETCNAKAFKRDSKGDKKREP
ncbi:hypothetical protein AYJ00_17365 [Shewanella algae]|nr:hypothetical protein AYJ00_17365 [Shewanella algae]